MGKLIIPDHWLMKNDGIPIGEYVLQALTHQGFHYLVIPNHAFATWATWRKSDFFSPIYPLNVRKR